MADTFVRRFHPPTAPWIASAAQCPIVRPTPMVIEVHPAILNRFQCFIRGGLHPPQTSKHLPSLAQVQTGESGLGPCLRSYGVAVLRFGHFVEIRRTVVIIESLTGLGK